LLLLNHFTVPITRSFILTLLLVAYEKRMGLGQQVSDLTQKARHDTPGFITVEQEPVPLSHKVYQMVKSVSRLIYGSSW
jgi:hypothetical protein